MSAPHATANAPTSEYGTLAYPIPTIRIDADRLRADLQRMEEALWTTQDRYRPKDGAEIVGWDGIALYSVSGDMHDLRAADHLPVPRTPAGDRCTYICDELLPQFGAPCLRVVFYRLKAGARIGTHRDYGENRFTSGAVRIHIPVITNDGVVMYVARRPYHFPLGTAWYFDASEYHSVENTGTHDRIHLVADLKMCPALERHLKPLTMADRLRFLRHAASYYLKVGEAFVHHVRSPAGRARIRARAKIVFGRQHGGRAAR
jgi:hypothetical protein